jgi:hypothetical protein
MIEIDIGVDYKYNSEKTPNLRFYLLDSSGNIPTGDVSYGINVDYNHELTIYKELQKKFNSRILIDETIEEDYTLVVQHTNGVYPDDYINGDFGIDITSLHIDEVDLTDLIHRKGVSYLDCTWDPYYLTNYLNNDKFSVEVLPTDYDRIKKNYHILNYRHNGIKGLNPYTYNRNTGEKEYLEGVFISNCGTKYVKDNHLYYICDNDVHFIAENSNNKDIYVEEGVLIHRRLADTCLNLNGRWEFKFKTPFYGWVVDNIFGND